MATVNSRAEATPGMAAWDRVRTAMELLLRCNFSVIFFAMLAIATFLSCSFLTFGNVSNLFQQDAVVGIVAVAMTFVVLTANSDFSVVGLGRPTR
jgi:ribose transport system permease protein